MAMQKPFLSLAIMAAVLIELTMAATYTVGGSNGSWDTSTKLQTWASSQTFLVGDSITFQYDPSHNVIEVPKSDYDDCTRSNLIQIYNDGSTTIPLTSPGKRYFICGTEGHCKQGMKLEINTLATNASPPSSAPKSSSSPSAPRSSSSPSAPESSSPSSSPSETPKSAPTKSPPLSSDSPVANSPSNSLSPIAPSETSESAPAPSAAPVSYEGSFRAGLVMGFGAFVMLLAF